MGILDIFIEDYEEKSAPPEQDVLKVAVVADVIFFAIGKWEEDNNGIKFTPNADGQIAVKVADFIRPVVEMIRTVDDEAYERAKNGKLPLDHPHVTTKEIVQTVPATKRQI